MEKTFSLPKIAKTKSKSQALELKKERLMRKKDRTIVRRLYTKDIREIKKKNNEFWHKTRFDRSLETKFEQLRKCKNKSMLSKTDSEIVLNSCEKVETECMKKLKKLQESMRQAFILKGFSENAGKKNLENPHFRDGGTLIEISEENSMENVEEILEGHKSRLKLVNTRIKVIMITLPELQEKCASSEINHKKDIKLVQKLQNLTNLLEKYQKTREKLKVLVKLCTEELKRQNMLTPLD